MLAEQRIAAVGLEIVHHVLEGEGEEVVRGGDEQVVVHGTMVEHEAYVPHRAEAVLIGIGAVIEHIQFKARVARGGLLRPGGELTAKRLLVTI